MAELVFFIAQLGHHLLVHEAIQNRHPEVVVSGKFLALWNLATVAKTESFMAIAGMHLTTWFQSQTPVAFQSRGPLLRCNDGVFDRALFLASSSSGW